MKAKKIVMVISILLFVIGFSAAFVLFSTSGINPELRELLINISIGIGTGGLVAALSADEETQRPTVKVDYAEEEKLEKAIDHVAVRKILTGDLVFLQKRLRVTTTIVAYNIGQRCRSRSLCVSAAPPPYSLDASA